MKILPPHNQEAEQGLLAALMINNAVFYDVYGTVKEDDFFLPVHGEIYTAIEKQIQAGRDAGPIAIKNQFDGHPALDRLGGGMYLAELASSIVSTVNAVDYARLIADLAERRRLLPLLEKYASELRFDCQDRRPLDEIKSELSCQIEIAGRSAFVRSKREVAEAMLMSFQRTPEFCPTGLKFLDEVMLGGLYPGFTYGFAGAAKRGKTTLAHTISHNLNSQGIEHAYIALEMGSEQIEMRNVARDLGASCGRFYHADAVMIDRAAKMLPVRRNHTLYLDMAGATFEQIKAEITRLVLRKRIRGYVLDYWQLVKGGEKNQNKADFLYDVAQWCADFSRRHKVWCILLAQVNKSGETFNSTGLEKACDQLYFIEKADTGRQEQELWLNMRFSRYTPIVDLGGELTPAFWINPRGPFLDEV